MEFMCIKELWRNVFGFISFDITSFDLYNASSLSSNNVVGLSLIDGSPHDF